MPNHLFMHAAVDADSPAVSGILLPVMICYEEVLLLYSLDIYNAPLPLVGTPWRRRTA